MAVSHVILTEFHYKNPTPYFIDYVKQYTDSPMLVRLDKSSGQYRPGRLLRANELAEHKDISNGDWKFVNVDARQRPVRDSERCDGTPLGQDARQLEHEIRECRG